MGASLGRQGEAAAVELMESEGARIIDVNVRIRSEEVAGELDIVAWDGPVLCFVEVKTRRGSGSGTPFESVSPAKQRQLARLAAVWLAENCVPDETPIRFDVVGVVSLMGRLDTTRICGAFGLEEAE